MTRFPALMLCLLLLTGSLALAAPVVAPKPTPVMLTVLSPKVETPVLTGRLIVKLQQPATEAMIQQVSRVLRVTVVKPVKKGPYLLVKPIPGKGLVSMAQLDLPIEFIEPEVRMLLLPIVEKKQLPILVTLPLGRALDARDVPNDPYFKYQWGFQDGIYGVGLPTARALTKGAGVIVAILDTGVRQNAPDLAQTKFLAGLNVTANNANTDDDNGHGTHVCGTIAQSTNNGTGCAGMAPAATILPVKVLDKAGRGSNYTIGVGIRYAVDKGARVLNMSIGGVSSQTLKDAIEYARSKGAIVCAAAGNSGKRGITFPAAYPSTISVGATMATGQAATFSQYGPGLTLAAPGAQILQQTFGQSNGQFGFFYFSGTSMACPHVAAACALVLSLNPRLTPDQVRARLTETARDMGKPGWDEHFGAGILDVGKACQETAAGAPVVVVPPPVLPPPTPVPPPPAPVPPVPPPPVESSLATEVLALFNAERTKAGMPAVTLEARLTTAAQLHAADMRARGVMSHTGGDGSNPGTRITRAGYAWRTYGEIIGAGQQTAAAILSSWMNSPPHKAIILGGQFKECGIARDGSYWCSTWGAR